MQKIFVKPNSYALVDDGDYHLLSGFKWHLRGIKKQYASGRVFGKDCYMHRIIMGTPVGMETDHINGDPLDNRRSNLRVCTPRQNQANSVLRNTNKTGYKGVRLHGSKWVARIRHEGGVAKILGSFDSKEEAAEAYRAAAIEQYGEFVRI